MNRTSGNYGILLFYPLIILISFIGFYWGFSGFSEIKSISNTWLYSLSLVNLTHFSFAESINQPLLFHILSLFIIQTSGLFLLTILLWSFWQLFGETHEKVFNIYKAFRLTVLVTLICESALFLFFLYTIPVEITGNSMAQKIVAALSLAIHSFNNAGFSHAGYLSCRTGYSRTHLNLAIVAILTSNRGFDCCHFGSHSIHPCRCHMGHYWMGNQSLLYSTPSKWKLTQKNCQLKC